MLLNGPTGLVLAYIMNGGNKMYFMVKNLAWRTTISLVISGSYFPCTAKHDSQQCPSGGADLKKKKVNCWKNSPHNIKSEHC